ncbi:MAG: glutamyl-tRNA reductase [Deltaproteobacteria bacterium]|nr:glutamyl-tRNA reductase [Deltaproteobacteria bacterium]MBW2415640.1 glutamyl-tRNA reductase [Deltaproteobacteria bacterium]
MNVVLVGLNHRTAPLDVRERHTVARLQLVEANEELARDDLFEEAALISTCNRTERLAVAAEPHAAADRLRLCFGESADPDVWHLYELHGIEAVQHVFRVASGLDSMVLGEAQILGQLKDAYRAAFEAGACGAILHHLFQRAFRTAKRVRSETGLGAGQVSLARVGTQLAGEIFESLEDKRVLLVGAGEMAESALAGLRDAGARDLVILNRTVETAEELAGRLGALAGGLDRLGHELAEADVVITSLTLDRPLLSAADVREAISARHGRALLIVDLGIPRNIATDVNSIDDVYLYDLDDLDVVAQRGQARRRAAMVPAEAIVRREGDRFDRWRAGLAAVPLIKALRESGEGIAEQEVRRALAGVAPDDVETRRAMERLATSLLGRLIHAPLTRLRTEAEEGNAPYYADAIAEIFGLTEEDD